MTQIKNRKGYRGYIGTRMAMDRSTPQHIQQMVMRDYCSKRDMHYLLAVVEYRMDGCTMVLDALLKDELDAIEGVVMYSLYLMPQSKAKRMEMYQKLFDAGCTLHMAVENLVIRNWDDAQKIEDVWLTNDVISQQNQGLLETLTMWDKVNAAN